MGKPSIAVIYLPGNNCEEETLRAVIANGMGGDIVRWNQEKNVHDYDGYVIVGGWAYEDRIRAGAIAAKDPIMHAIIDQAKTGKPVLGICNGAQVLVEAGMIPSIKEGVKMALAPNINPLISGYYCTWAALKSVQSQSRCAFTKTIKEGEIILMPIAHGEGRFMTSDASVITELESDSQIIFQYSTRTGEILSQFPTNPNGSVENIAAICNKQGNVMAMMPHPERAAFVCQLPHTKEKMDAAGNLTLMQQPALAGKLFESMKLYIEEGL